MSEGCLHLHLLVQQMHLFEEIYTATMHIFYQLILLGIEPMILAFENVIKYIFINHMLLCVRAINVKVCVFC